MSDFWGTIVDALGGGFNLFLAAALVVLNVQVWNLTRRMTEYRKAADARAAEDREKFRKWHEALEAQAAKDRKPAEFRTAEGRGRFASSGRPPRPGWPQAQ